MTSGSRSRSVFQGTALTIGTLVQVLSGFFTQLLLMRYLIPEDFGRFAVILAGGSLVQTFLSLRLNVLIIRLQDDETHLHRLCSAALIWETAAATAVTLAWLGVAGLISTPVLILVASLTLGQWVNQAVAFYERGMAYGSIALVEAGSQVSGHAVALALLFSDAGPLCLYIRELTVVLVRLGAFGIIGALPKPYWRKPSMAALRELWRHSRGIWSEGILEGIFARTVVLVSGGLYGLHGAGLFAQSQRLAMLPHQFLAPVLSRMSVNLFSRSVCRDARNRLALKLATGAIALLSMAVAVTWFWARELVPWLFGEHWRDAGMVLRSMIGVIFFLSLFDLARSFCYSHGWVKPILIGRVVQIVVILMAFLILQNSDISHLGWLLSIAYASSFLVTTSLTLRHNHSPAAD